MAGLCEGVICRQFSCLLTGGCSILSCPCHFAQATCMCRPGMTSINNNASEGCHVSCKPHSCDRSATCQVTPDRKTRLAQGPRGVGTGAKGAGHKAGWVECTVYSSVRLHSAWQGGLGRVVGSRGWSILSLISLSGSPAVCAKMMRWVTVMPAMDICSMRFGGPIRMAWCSCG